MPWEGGIYKSFNGLNLQDIFNTHVFDIHMGGDTPAYFFLMRALYHRKNGKSLYRVLLYHTLSLFLGSEA
jgi:hypothetical protein